MKTFSIVIPTWTPNEEFLRMELDLCKSLRPYCDELIVVEDGGNCCPEFEKYVDNYTYDEINHGFTATVNYGLAIAKSDFIAVVNSDVKLLDGNPRDMCLDDPIDAHICDARGKVTFPIVVDGWTNGEMYGGFFVIPRTVLDKHGALDPKFRDFGSDAEYSNRVRHHLGRVNGVKISHPVGSKSYNYKRNNAASV